jgi:hypothetical protein
LEKFIGIEKHEGKVKKNSCSHLSQEPNKIKFWILPKRSKFGQMKKLMPLLY